MTSTAKVGPDQKEPESLHLSTWVIRARSLGSFCAFSLSDLALKCIRNGAAGTSTANHMVRVIGDYMLFQKSLYNSRILHVDIRICSKDKVGNYWDKRQSENAVGFFMPRFSFSPRQYSV